MLTLPLTLYSQELSSTFFNIFLHSSFLFVAHQVLLEQEKYLFQTSHYLSILYQVFQK